MILITATMLCLMVKKGMFKRLKIKIRLALFINLLMQLVTIYLMLLVILREGHGVIGVAWTRVIRIVMASSGLLLIGIHWQFTNFYMQTACLLRIIMRAKNDDEIRKAERRKKQLFLLEYAVYGLILIVLIFCCIFSDDKRAVIWNVTFYMFISISDVALLLITALSVRHINKHSKGIEAIGIKTDSMLMKLYAVCWVGVNVFAIAIFTLGFFLVDQYWYYIYFSNFDWFWGTYDYAFVLRLQISYICLFMVSFVFLTMLNILILVAYYRLGKKLSSRAKLIVTNTLRTESLATIQFG